MPTKTKPPTKKAQLISLLDRQNGADIAVICKRLNWQSHSARAALSGLRKEGYALSRDRRKPGAPLRYRIVHNQAEGAN